MHPQQQFGAVVAAAQRLKVWTGRPVGRKGAGNEGEPASAVSSRWTDSRAAHDRAHIVQPRARSIHPLPTAPTCTVDVIKADITIRLDAAVSAARIDPATVINSPSRQICDANRLPGNGGLARL